MTQEVTYTRNSKLLEVYQKIVNAQVNSNFIKLSQKECKDLVGLIDTLEEENRRLFLQTLQVSKDLHTLYGGGD